MGFRYVAISPSLSAFLVFVPAGYAMGARAGRRSGMAAATH